MKKSIVLSTFIICALSGLGVGYLGFEKSISNTQQGPDSNKVVTPTPLKFLDQLNEDEFFLAFGNRFNTTITKTELHEANSIVDIFPEGLFDEVTKISGNKVAMLHENSETTELGNGKELNNGQLNLLKRISYSNNFHVNADVEVLNARLNKSYPEHFVYYITVVPETEATYQFGKDAIIDYIRTNIKYKAPKVGREDWKPGKISVEITKEGKIGTVKLKDTSGFPEFDALMVDLVNSLPGKWNPALDHNGKPISQTFNLSFGNAGC